MESATQEIFSIGSLTLDLVVKSDKNFNIKSFTSKTTDTTYFNLNYSSYLVFKYHRKVENERINESVFFSYPHIYSLKKSFKRIVDVYTKYKKDIFIEIEDKENYSVLVSNEFKKVFILEGTKKTIRCTFHVNQDMNDLIETGVLLVINGEENQVFFNMDMVFTVHQILQDFNLLLASQNLFNIMVTHKRNKKEDSRLDVTEEDA